MRTEWKVIMRGSKFMGTGDDIGLFCDGILAVSYYEHGETFTVNVHPHGEFRVSHQIVVADEETARRVCREIAGAPAEETPLPTWAADALRDTER